MTQTLVLGLGNPFRGDDGLGPEVIAALRQEKISSDVTIIDGGTPGLETVLLWQDHQRVIIVDAANMRLDPGQWKRFLLGGAILHDNNTGMQGTLHNAGLAEAITLAEALDMLPSELIFYGVQPARIDWSVGLSSEVQPAVTAVTKAILVELNNPENPEVQPGDSVQKPS